VHNDDQWPVGLVASCPDRDAQSLAQGTLSQFHDCPFAAKERVLAAVGFQQKAFEVAEVVEYQAGDFAGILGFPSRFASVVLAGHRAGIAVKGRGN